MTAPASAAIMPPSDFDEEVARAELYGLLAQLFYAPPPPELLQALRQAETHAPDAGGFLEAPWQELVAEARAMGDDAIAAEYDALFGGMGKPEVYLFGSHYLTGFLNEKPLVGLRNDLQALGLARGSAVSETEDHIAVLFEVMRYLIAGEDAGVSNLSRQREFFAALLGEITAPATLRVKVRPTGASIYWVIGGAAALLTRLGDGEAVPVGAGEHRGRGPGAGRARPGCRR